MTSRPKCPHCGRPLRSSRPTNILSGGRGQLAKARAERAVRIIQRSGGATDDEIDAITGWGHQCTTPVMVYLRRDNVIEWKRDEDGARVTRKTRKGCAAGVNVLVKK